MPRERERGASPEVELAIIDSDLHHVREQADRDRRAMAERMVELRKWRDRMELSHATATAQIARLADTCDRLEVARHSDAQQLGELVALSHRGRGAFWVLAGLASFAGVGTILELVRFLFWRHP